jgi:hypothetical protein
MSRPRNTLKFILDLWVRQGKTEVVALNEAPVIDLASSSIGNEARTIAREVPLNDRVWAQLAILQKVIVSDAVLQWSTTGSGGIRGSARGLRGYSTQFCVSGGQQEPNNVSVLRSNYTAEYGHTSGGIINTITQLATNFFNGNVYEVLQNKGALEASCIRTLHKGRASA